MEIQTWSDRQRNWKMFLIKAKLSQKEFAERFGFNQGQLSQWLTGKQKIGSRNEGELLAAFSCIRDESIIPQSSIQCPADGSDPRDWDMKAGTTVKQLEEDNESGTN